MSTLFSSSFNSREPVVMDDEQIEAAHAATEVGQDDPQEGFGAIVVPLFAAPVLLAIIGVIALVGGLP